MTLPCIVCGKALESAVRSVGSRTDPNQPSEGTVFSSHGNYGSTVWDPMTGVDMLEINVCDPCLVEHAGRVLHVKRVTQAHDTVLPWDPERTPL